MQDISLNIATDSSSPLPEKLYNFFQPETLEGENAFWCEDCQQARRVTKTLFYIHIPTILIVHPKRLILGEKIQNHIPFDTTLEMEPFMAPGLGPAQKMELIGMISHQGTEKHGHYVAATKKGKDWIMMMIAFITIKSSLVPSIEGLCAKIYFRFEISVVCSHLLLFFFVKEKTC